MLSSVTEIPAAACHRPFGRRQNLGLSRTRATERRYRVALPNRRQTEDDNFSSSRGQASSDFGAVVVFASDEGLGP